MHNRRVSHPSTAIVAARFVAVAAGLSGVGLSVAGASATQAATPPVVLVAELADVIHPISAEYVVGALAEAEAVGADLFVLRIDTPGGLDTSMREIVQAMTASNVPVCLFVAPSGARSASAGFFMAMAADFVAMAPGTNMGAASPVAVGGGQIDETMQRKLIHDAEAYIGSLAARSGRPPELAAEAVSDGKSWRAADAVELGLADLLAEDLSDLFAGLAGRQLREGSELPADLAAATVLRREPSLRQRILSILANPQVAYVLMLLGIAGLYFELSTPGAVLPGVLGGISLVLALLAFQVLPIDFAGLALIGLAVVFFILEIKVTSYGLLTVAGLVSFVLGSLMLFPGPIPELRLSVAFVLPTAFGVGGIAAALLWLVVRTHRGRVRTGTAGLVSEVGRAQTDMGPDRLGRVFVHGEIWLARSDVPVRAGEQVEVLSVDNGMVLRVRPAASQKGS